MKTTRTQTRFHVSAPCLAAVTILLLLAGGPATSSIPEAEVNVSLAAGYQGTSGVAVDPADPDALVVVGADDTGTGPAAWSSADGGGSFSRAALPLAFGGHTFAEGSPPAVTVDRSGIWYAAYEVHDLDGGSNPIDSSLVIARSYDGLVWEALAIVEDNRGAGADPAVETPHLATDLSPTGCTSYAGRLYLVWIRKSGGDRMVYRSYSSDEGAAWYSPAKINDGASGSEDLWRPRVASGPEGQVHVAWLDDLRKTIVVDRSTNGGYSFGTDVDAAAVTLGCGTGDCGEDLGCSGGALHGSTPSLAVDTGWTAARGTLYVGFADEVLPADGMDVFVTASSDEGATWSPPVAVTSVSTRQQYGPALDVHPVDGTVHATWYDRRGDAVGPDCATEVWHAVSEDAGVTWTDETVVSSASSDFSGDARGEGAHLAIAAASTRVFPVWTDSRGPDHEIYLARIARTGGTLIPGATIDANTTWAAAGSPFVVTGDVTIEVGSTLTIEAASELRFATCDALRSGADANRVELIVEGVLDVDGTLADPVTLHSGGLSPAKGDWYGVRFQNTSDSSDSTLRHATIEHTRYAIRLSSSSPVLEDVGIALASIQGIEGSARSGVPFSPARVTVDDAGTPVSLSSVFGTWTDVTLQNSTGAAGTIGGGSLDLRLVGLQVQNNAGGGLIVTVNGGGLEVILSEFNGNGIAEPGLTVNGTGPRTLVANDFGGNDGDGLLLNNDSSGWPVTAFYANNLNANGAAAIRMDTGSLPADARRNWWGALGAEMTEYPKNISGIWDIHDVATLRHVDFRDHAGSAILNDGDLESYLVVSDGMNDNETVIYGGAVAREGVLRVEVSTDGGSSWFDATVEGAAWSYAWAPAPGVYTVQSRVTDLLSNVEVAPDQKVVTIGSGPTLSGTMLANETWTALDTIVLTGDVVVPEGVTLTVDAGTTVHAQFLTDAAYGGLDPSRIEIIVEGVLQSNGASGTEVIWDSSRVGSGASKGDWYGIRYRDTTTDELSIVTNTEIGHGVNGVKLEDAAPDILDSIISDCSVDGLTGDSGTLSKALWRLNGNTIQDNDGDGVDVDGSTEVEVLGATVTGNGAVGMRIDASPDVVTIRDATVSGNGAAGLSIASGSTGFRLFDSDVLSNGGDGIHVSTGGDDIRLERLLVSGNGEDGIEISGGTEVVLLKSTVTGNRRGLRIGSPRLVGAYNTITGNTGDGAGDFNGSGLEYYSGTGSPAAIGMSDFDNGVDHEIYISAARALNARRNYWGAASTTVMNGAGFPADLSEFWDIHDDRDHGVVDYDNWAAASVAGSAPGDLAAHITWPGDGAALDVTSVIVTGVAYALDGIDRVEVCVRQSGDPVCGDGAGETPFGVVTGKEGWSFEWFPPASGLFELQARVVDTSEIRSVPGETITIDVTLPGPTVNGPVALSGPIIANQTWSGDIELTGDVIVEPGATLTLLAGTDVKARALVDDRFGGEDTSRIELIVRGNLVTQGTVGVPVTFASTRPAPERRDWFGIRFEAVSSAALNDLDSTSVEGAWHGIEFRETFSMLDDVSCFNNHGIGLYLSSGGGTFPASATITGGAFSDNGTNGIQLRSIHGEWLLDGVEIVDNDNRGFYVHACNNDGTLTLQDSLVQGNTNQGLYLYYCGRPVEILGTTFDGNLGFGVYSNQAAEVVVRGSTFTNQTGVGLSLGYPSEITLSKNTFSGNQSSASIANSTGESVVVFNEFGPWSDFGADGISFTGGSAAVSRNTHFNNFREFTSGAPGIIVSNAVAASVNARVNYWDPDTTAEMVANPFPSNISSIEDVEDNPAWGRVDWRAQRAAAVDIVPPQVCGFTNPVNGDTLTGTTFVLRGAAAADVGIQLVELSTDGGASWLPASGEELWTFEWTPPQSDPYTLQCRVTDNDSGVQAVPASISVQVNAANITTSGTLTTDEIWSGVIVLTGDVIVPNGITLTIQEGTVVKATPQSDDQFGGLDTSKIELIVDGKLLLEGSAVLPVTFTSDRTLPDLPTAGDWYGIRLTDTADSTVTIHDLVVEAAVRGIWSYAGSHQDVVDCLVRDTSEDGIYLLFGGGVRDPADDGLLVSGNTVERTGGSDYGIFVDRTGSHASWNDATHRVEDNTTDDTGNYGIYFRTGYMERLEVTGNVVSNADYGIHVRSSTSTSYTNLVQITGNQVTNMVNSGIYAYLNRLVRIESNTVTGANTAIRTYSCTEARIERNDLSVGTYDGIYLNSSGGTVEAYIHRNSITGFDRDGINATGLSRVVALYNTIDGIDDDALQLGVYNAAAIPSIHWNNILGSTGYDVRVTHAAGADMRRNHWSGTNGEMLAEGYPSEISEIWDIEDDDADGRIDYRGVENLAIDTNVTLESRFVWPFAGDTISRRTITLEGTAYAEAGVQLVEVSTDGGMSWLPASGTDTWSFSFTPVADGLQTFLCRVTDGDSAVEATPDTVTVTFDGTLPTTEGTLPDNETWSGPSPIVLTGDVIVPVGVTLTIDPGTLIRVQPLADNRRGGVDSNRIELIVEGTLNLLGTALSPVTFTSDRTPDPLPGDWYGIRLADTADSTSTIHDLVVEAGVRGIWSYPGSHQDVVDCAVRDMTQDGIFLQFGGTARDPADDGMLVSGNTVERTGSSRYGIYVNRTGAAANWDTAIHRVNGNTTDDTGSYGIYVRSGNAELVEVDSNLVSGAGNGIYVSGTNSTSYTNRVEVTGNQVSDGGTNGIYVYTGRSVLIRQNTVTGGDYGIRTYTVMEGRIEQNDLSGGNYDGLLLTNSSGTADSYLFRNSISGYGRYGVSSTNLTGLVTLYNTIDNVGGNAFELSLYNAAAVPRVHWNNILDSTGYDARAANSIGADMRRNYWSGTNGEMVAEGYPAEISKIWDVEDDITKGRIDYRGVENLAIDTNVTLESRFVWPFAGDTISRRTITLEGTAYAEAGVQLVEISTDGGMSWLPASGTDTWSFSFTPLADGLQTFLCRVTDGDSAVEATPDTVTVTFDGTLPTTEGTLPDNETWSGPSPIVLTGDVIVPAGVTLTIDPGTQIRVQPLADNRRGGIDTNRIELIVEGTLLAQGTGPGSIEFTSDSITPARGHWYGIRYAGLARAFPELRGLYLVWGMTGLSDSDSVGIPDLDGIDLEQMQQDGIHVVGAPLDADDWTLRNLEVSQVDGNGVYLDAISGDVSMILDGLTVQDVGSYGLYTRLPDDRNLTIRNSSFDTSSNSHTVYTYGAWSTLLESVAIHHSGAAGFAYQMYSGVVGDTLTILDSEITGGTRSVYAYRVNDAAIRRSRITDGEIGFYVQGYSASSLVHAVLENNRISDTSSDGVYVGTYAGAELHYNDLYNIAGYTLNNQSPLDIDASGNYWGEDTVTEMIAKGCDADIDAIYDRWENGAKGLVTYCDYATNPFGDQPTIRFHDNAGLDEIHWTSKSGLTYDLIRGDMANLAIAGATVDLGAVICEDPANGAGIWVDGSPDPSAGQAWFYLLRDHVTPGTYGVDSGGRERIPASGDCP